ncbi:hypothetical protein [Ideonella sp. YS5]|uniref:hypothetical protein n=1 Tax=Ideonella sp. YS5 TaxID=3453714 RepID=UPI003EED0055
MRLLFLDRPTSRITARQWLMIALALALVEAAGFAVYVMRPAERGLSVGLSTPHEQCVARGIGQYEVRREWPRTMDGRDAGTLIESRCTLDPASFQ